VFGFKLVVNRQIVPTLLGKADAAPECAFDLRNGAWTVMSALKKDFHQEIQKSASADTVPQSSAKMRFQGGCSEEDHSASGFACFAREPELMVGAEGGAYPHRDNQITTSADVKKRKIERATRFLLSPL
jgi:hypothetical protein